MEGHYEKAIETYGGLYERVCTKFTVRPPADRIAGINPKEEQKFAILTNLIISYMLFETEKPSRATQQAVYELLRNERLLHVRYTQSLDELNLYKLATFVK